MPPEQKDHLTSLPSELLEQILHSLPCLSILRVRLAHPRLAACVATMPEYQTYQTVFDHMKKRWHRISATCAKRKCPDWPLKRAGFLFKMVREGCGMPMIDYEVFQCLEKWPEAAGQFGVFDAGDEYLWGGPEDEIATKGRRELRGGVIEPTKDDSWGRV